MKVTVWRWLIRRKRLREFVVWQADRLAERGYLEGALVLGQLAENLRVGMTLTPPPDNTLQVLFDDLNRIGEGATDAV